MIRGNNETLLIAAFVVALCYPALASAARKGRVMVELLSFEPRFHAALEKALTLSGVELRKRSWLRNMVDRAKGSR